MSTLNKEKIEIDKEMNKLDPVYTTKHYITNI